MKKILTVIIFCMIGINMFSLYYFHFQYKNIITYAEKILDVNFSKYVQYAEGTITKEWHYENKPFFVEEYAILKFTVRDGYEDQMIEELDKKCGADAKLSTPLFEKTYNSIKNEINNKKIYKSYELLLDGKYGNVTRYLIVCVVWEDDGMYIYILG